jgi:hypothetical protein
MPTDQRIPLAECLTCGEAAYLTPEFLAGVPDGEQVACRLAEEFVAAHRARGHVAQINPAEGPRGAR